MSHTVMTGQQVNANVSWSMVKAAKINTPVITFEKNPANEKEKLICNERNQILNDHLPMINVCCFLMQILLKTFCISILIGSRVSVELLLLVEGKPSRPSSEPLIAQLLPTLAAATTLILISFHDFKG